MNLFPEIVKNKKTAKKCLQKSNFVSDPFRVSRKINSTERILPFFNYILHQMTILDFDVGHCTSVVKGRGTIHSRLTGLIKKVKEAYRYRGHMLEI